MKCKLYDYQAKALKMLMDYSDLLFNSCEKDKYILLKAITGAGKTVIAGTYIEEMFKSYNNLAFIWISVGKGGLHLQTRDSLSEKLSKSIEIKLVEEALLCSSLEDKDVLILNWENLNTKKKDKHGIEYFDNRVMKKGEKRNLIDLCTNTKDNDTKIVLIIDESHNSAKSKTAKEIINLIKPEFTLEITATPKRERVPTKDDELKGKSFYIPVSCKEVINEGVIKKSIKLNDMSNSTMFSTITELMILESIAKKKELSKAYELEHENINPLVLIQLPDGKDSEFLKDEVLTILDKNGYSIENEKVAIWLSNIKTKNVEYISDLNSKVDFLIFKQAIATGWDCPRASILVRFREVKSTTFNLQTIGRILRMPQRRHYSNDCLNHSYIYTNSEYSINTGDYEQVLPLRQYLKESFKDDVLSIILPSEKIKFEYDIIKDRILFQNFKRKMKGQSLNLNLDELVLNIKISTTNISEFDKNSNTEVKSIIEKKKTIIYSNLDIEMEFNKFIRSLSDKYISSESIQVVLLRYFDEIAELNNDELKITKAILLNKSIIYQYINDIKNEHKNKLESYVEEFEFKFPEERFTTEKETIDYEKCAYHKHFKSKYKTEIAFEEYLEKLENIKYWIKNTDGGDGLSITYKYDNVDHEFYPDYIIKFKDGNIGLYEVKDINDKDKDTITKEKMDKLKTYSLNNGYKCGKIEVLGGKSSTDKWEVNLPTLPLELK